MHAERQALIRAFVKDKDFVSIGELRALCPDVSAMTIHRDITALEEEGLLSKVRGGARVLHYTTEPLFDIRSRVNTAGKQLIAEKALPLLRPGASVFLDAGTTNLTLARLLPDIELTIFTTGPSIALELARLVNPSINLCGGNLNRTNLAISGQSTLAAIDQINIDIAFLGASGCTPEAGFVCGKESEMLVKRRILEKARTRVVLCDGSKFNRLLPFTFARFDEIDLLVSDQPLPEEFREPMGALKVL